MRAIKVSDLQNFTYQEEHASVLLPEQQPHALHQQNGFLGTASYTPNDKHSFEASTWLQSLTREIPPLRTQRISEAIQFDTLIRSQFEWSADWNIYQHKILVTLRDESNAYRDPRNGIDANNQFAAQQILSQHQLHFSEKFQTHFGLNANWIQVSTPNYQNAKTSLSRYQVYFKPVYQLKNIPLQFEGAIRYNQDRDSIAPFTGHIKAFWKDEYHRFSLELTRAHRFPSFNDLFWEPAGNPDLKPENSQQLNFGYQFLHTSSNKQVKLQCNLFYKNIDNWILWAPIDQFLWSPSNILEVTSMGIDLNQSFSYRISEEQAFSIQLNGLYQSVRNTGPINTPRAQKGENLIYMPEFKLSGSLRWEYQNFTAMYIHNWRSKIYTSPDLSEYLDALNIGQFRLSYEINVLQQEIQVFVRAHNLWNTSYYYQPNLPAPGVRWRAGFLIQKR
jgi:iron complex outermembrane receptor protein